MASQADRASLQAAADVDSTLPPAPYATYRRPLERAAEHALEYLEGLPERHVGADAGAVQRIRADLAGTLPDVGAAPDTVIDEIAAAADAGLTAMSGPRYFGFVIGGTLPAAMAADWLVSAWDQNAGMHVPAPAAAEIEAIAARWLVDALGLADETSVGFTTGATMANLACAAAARHELLRRAGWNVEADGLQGAPTMTVAVGDEVHPSMTKALRLLGLGQKTALRVPVDDQGRMRADDLERAVSGLDGPVLVVAQAGNVNTGAFDPLADIVPIVRALPNAWLHVDGAFGLWAAASPRLRHLVAGVEDADSAATDAHKWLNVPYDAGLSFVRNEPAAYAAMSMTAAYLPTSERDRDPFDYVPEMSRRARGIPIYAALRSLGRQGLAEMIERDCAIAARMAAGLSTQPGIRVLNDVVLNQILVRFAEDDAVTREVIRRVQADGTLWAGGTVWHGLGAMRISVSGWSTSENDGDRSVEAIVRCLREVQDGR